jgi:uncharacterized membrane protein YcaP (DUF421 family)
MDWILGNWPHLGAVAGKAVLMYVVAIAGLRLGERRTVAQWAIIDFVAAVAIGAIVGRTAIAGRQSFVTGAVALVTLVVVHRVAVLLRSHPRFQKLFSHRIRVLVHDGKLRHRQLRLCGLTDNDVFAHLREHGVGDVADLRYLLYEAKGALTIVARDADDHAPLVQAALDSAIGFDS